MSADRGARNPLAGRMRDRRTVDELSTEELQRLLAIRKRAERVAAWDSDALRPAAKGDGERPPWARDALATEAAPPSEAHPPDRAGPVRRMGPISSTASLSSAPQARPSEKSGPPLCDTSASEDRAPESRGRLHDKILLFVEFALAIALLGVLIASLRTMGEVNRAAREAQALSTPTATPLIHVALLPGGHTPPDAPGGAAPEEVPAHLRDRVSDIQPVAMPTPGPQHATRILIPAIGVDAPVVEGDDWEALKQGAGHHLNSANPGEPGNCVISAHNDIFGEIFRRLPDVDLGDEIVIHTARRVHRYIVTQKRVIEPEDVSVMHPTSSPVLTLISCYPYGVDTHRIVVAAELQP